MKNRRKSMRIPVATIAHIAPHGLQKSQDALIRELSVDGMGCYVDQCCQKGAMILIKLRLDLPDPDEGVLQASITGQIKWVKPLDKEKQFAIGIEFRDMDINHPELFSYLKHLEKQSETTGAPGKTSKSHQVFFTG